MKVYIVMLESGKIYAVRKNKGDAENDRRNLESVYESAVIESFDVC